MIVFRMVMGIGLAFLQVNAGNIHQFVSYRPLPLELDLKKEKKKGISPQKVQKYFENNINVFSQQWYGGDQFKFLAMMHLK